MGQWYSGTVGQWDSERPPERTLSRYQESTSQFERIAVREGGRSLSHCPTLSPFPFPLHLVASIFEEPPVAKLLTEFIGTFFLVFTIGLTVIAGTDLAPLAIGSALMVMVYMGGHISGAHYNPAVTLAIMMRGKIEFGEAMKYMAIQVIAAAAAAESVWMVTGGSTFAVAPGSDATTIAALLSEVLFTFALALVVLNVATSPKTEGNSYYGLAIGFTVMVGAFAVGGISGGAFNPAVGLGPMIIDAFMGDGGFRNAWLYIVGPGIGGALAAVVYKMQHTE